MVNRSSESERVVEIVKQEAEETTASLLMRLCTIKTGEKGHKNNVFSSF